MKTNNFLYLMTGCFLFGTTMFFKNKSSELENQLKYKKMENLKIITDAQIKDHIDKQTYLKNPKTYEDAAKWMRQEMLKLNGTKKQHFELTNKQYDDEETGIHFKTQMKHYRKHLKK